MNTTIPPTRTPGQKIAHDAIHEGMTEYEIANAIDTLIRDHAAAQGKVDQPIKDDVEGELAEGLKALAIRLGKPLVRTSFPGPDAHKLSLDEYAFEIGKLEIGIALGMIETTEIESIDGHLPKVRFDAPFENIAEARLAKVAAVAKAIEDLHHKICWELCVTHQRNTRPWRAAVRP